MLKALTFSKYYVTPIQPTDWTYIRQICTAHLAYDALAAVLYPQVWAAAQLKSPTD